MYTKYNTVKRKTYIRSINRIYIQAYKSNLSFIVSAHTQMLIGNFYTKVSPSDRSDFAIYYSCSLLFVFLAQHWKFTIIIVRKYIRWTLIFQMWRFHAPRRSQTQIIFVTIPAVQCVYVSVILKITFACTADLNRGPHWLESSKHFDHNNNLSTWKAIKI